MRPVELSGSVGTARNDGDRLARARRSASGGPSEIATPSAILRDFGPAQDVSVRESTKHTASQRLPAKLERQADGGRESEADRWPRSAPPDSSAQGVKPALGSRNHDDEETRQRYDRRVSDVNPPRVDERRQAPRGSEVLR
jgi:hypothetical protein